MKNENHIPNTVNYILTEDHADEICKRFGKRREALEDWEVCELVDQLIDNYLFGENDTPS